MTPLYEILNNIRKNALSERDKGTQFEKLMQGFLKTYPLYADLFDEVWLWNEFPFRKEFGGVDLGIDLVAKSKIGEYWAVQCKCYDEYTQIDKPEVDSFIATSGRSFHDEDGKEVTFSNRLWISTTNRWNDFAEQTIKNQTPQVQRLSLTDLENSGVDWEKLAEGLFGNECLFPKFSIMEHQQEAINCAHDYFKDHERGKLIMACGTGKTFTSLKIAEKETNNSGFILYLVPSIALMGQTIRAWFEQSEKPLAAVCVCSDSKVSEMKRKRKRDEDYDEEDSVVDLAYPATTDCDKIAKHLKAINRVKKTGMTVVFSTYQSLESVSSAQKILLKESENAVFDFVICDEAHRTTGVTLKDDDGSEFVKVHDNEYIKARKRMYMTATPRIYSESARNRAEAADATLCSMDDESLYGEEIYRIGFGKSVEKQLLTDYKVLVVTLKKSELDPKFLSLIQSHLRYDWSDAAKLSGCLSAISKRLLADENLVKDSDPAPMRRVVAFCNSISNSKQVTQLFNECREVFKDQGLEGIQMVESHHVDGTMSAPKRDMELSWLKEISENANECRMLTNARCLSEGVDVPSLDAVLFLSPRDSQVDVVQSVGRVMRTAPGKKYGYIIIPVVVPEEMEADEALDNNYAFKVVWTVLNALRSHDDRFNAEINKIQFNNKSSRIIITTGGSETEGEGSEGGSTKETIKNILQHFGEFQKAFYGKLVLKCGDKHYFENWAKDVAEMSERRISRIKEAIKTDEDKKELFNGLLLQIRKQLNPTISADSFIEMLGQHYVSSPVFEALFQNKQFVESNPVSRVLQAAIDLLAEDDTTEKEKKQLEEMRKDIKSRVEGINDAEGRQRVIKELYEKFFSVAAKNATDQLGIVYTPIPVVDFIVHSVGYIIQKEFGRSISEENVHVIDPFTGTGTFISRLLQSGLIRQKDLKRKYEKELHANEIVLLAYYIASINIETVYHSLINKEEAEDEKATYQDFKGICLTDTFQLGEEGSAGDLLTKDFEINSQRLIDQRNTPITVIIGNPPYSVGQKNANDNAQNTHYRRLEGRIAETYVAGTKATRKVAVYDSYIKAFRWATDRLGNKGGIIGFVTPHGWIDGNSMDGMRKCFERDFSSIYVFDLKGNQRINGDLRKKQGGKIFVEGSMLGIAITILVKKPNKLLNERAQIYYHDIGDYLTTQQKFDIISRFRDISQIKWESIHPDDYGDWINHRNQIFDSYIILGDKKDKKANTFFVPIYSLGLNTARAAWAYNSSLQVVKDRAKEQIDFYNQTLEELNSGEKSELDFDTNKISWTRAVINDIKKRKIRYNLIDCSYREGMYRPFFKQQLLYYKPLNEMQYQIPQLFPTPEHKNLVICSPSIGEKKEFSCLIIDCTPDLHLIGANQCFPLYYYDNGLQEEDTLFDKAEGRDEWGYVRRSGITDYIFVHALRRYGRNVTKEDIFYYVYGFLHSPQYRKKFADDLRKSLPKLPLLEKELFWTFSKAGRQLAEIHLNYEKISPYSGCNISGINEDTNYRVQKMKFGKKNGNEDDKSVIIFNDEIKIENIPLEAYDYIVNGQSAIEWLMERYAVTTDSKTGFVNDPNDWCDEHNDPKYIFNLLLRIITVSLETQKNVASLPNFLEE